MTDLELKVGELAERTGVTVRTLHWYDEIDLLSPGHRTRSGHRIYGPAEIERLQKIRSLQQLGLSLDEIREALDRDRISLMEILELQAERLAHEARRLQGLRDRLETVLEMAREKGRIQPEELIQTMEAMTMFEKYYTPEQLERLARRKDEVGEDRIQQAQDEWQELYRDLAELMEAGATPEDPCVRALVEKAESLIQEFTSGDPAIRASLEKMYSQEGTKPMTDHGFDVDPGVHGFLNRAIQAVAEDTDAR